MMYARGEYRVLGRRGSLALCLFVLCLGFKSRAGPIHSDVAFTPRKGGSILRLQYSYTEADGHDQIRQVNASGARMAYIYGLEENLALIVNLPYSHVKVDRFKPKLGRFEETREGVGDITALAKYRFWQWDVGPQETLRWAALGGLEIRAGDSDFTSDSYDPIVGTVFTWRQNRHLFDADFLYQFNTGSGEFRHDLLRYDVAYSFRLAPALFAPGKNYEWNAVAELNGRYTTEGSHQVFLSPGLQYNAEWWAFEASIQLPVIQELARAQPETEYRFVVGFRFRW